MGFWAPTSWGPGHSALSSWPRARCHTCSGGEHLPAGHVTGLRGCTRTRWASLAESTGHAATIDKRGVISHQPPWPCPLCRHWHITCPPLSGQRPAPFAGGPLPGEPQGPAQRGGAPCSPSADLGGFPVGGGHKPAALHLQRSGSLSLSPGPSGQHPEPWPWPSSPGEDESPFPAPLAGA